MQEPPRKRPRREDDDVVEEYLKGPLATLAPSTVAEHDAVYHMQRYPDQRVANDRPRLDHEGLPIALLYHGFGHFLDIATGASTDRIFDIDQRGFEMNVDEFMWNVGVYCDGEDYRRPLCYTT